eukprot:gene551-731_t
MGAVAGGMRRERNNGRGIHTDARIYVAGGDGRGTGRKPGSRSRMRRLRSRRAGHMWPCAERKGGRLIGNPRRARWGCFLPDLTRLASGSSTANLPPPISSARARLASGGRQMPVKTASRLPSEAPVHDKNSVTATHAPNGCIACHRSALVPRSPDSLPPAPGPMSSSPFPDLGPWPALGYTDSALDRAALRRAEAAALAEQPDARAYLLGLIKNFSEADAA